MTTPAKPPSPPPPDVLAVWHAEDGRCEGCRRPMDRTLAYLGRDTHGDRRLVCPDCKERRPDPLAAAAVGRKKRTTRLTQREREAPRVTCGLGQPGR